MVVGRTINCKVSLIKLFLIVFGLGKLLFHILHGHFFFLQILSIGELSAVGLTDSVVIFAADFGGYWREGN